MQVCKYASMQVYKYESMQMCMFACLQVASVQIDKYACKLHVIIQVYLLYVTCYLTNMLLDIFLLPIYVARYQILAIRYLFETCYRLQEIAIFRNFCTSHNVFYRKC